jgi:23S rRNA-/tRNA-specific pseudouridylate synthase
LPTGREDANPDHPAGTIPEATLLEVRIENGRRTISVSTLRALQPAERDPLYGADRPVGGGSRLMLHAHSLTLEAGDSSRLSLACLPGADWAAELKRWQRTALQ